MNRLLLSLLLLLLFISAPPFTMAFNPFEVARIDQKPDAVLPLEKEFTDSDGTRQSLKALAAGRPMLLVPVLHRCPNICGVTLSGLMEAVRMQAFKPGRDFAVVAMSIDPKETPADAGASMDELRRRYPALAREVHAVTGSAPAIAAMTDALGYRYGWDKDINQYAHIAATAVVTPEGHLSRWLYGLSPSPGDVKLALTEAGQGRIGSWTDQLLLLCYHYDPTTGQYSPIIWDALRIGGAVTAASLLGFLGIAISRERKQRKERADG